jgi:transcriptional regulator of arginine metabolism
VLGVKTSRQEKIKEIIEKQNVETQEELAGALQAAGFVVTQATVSRDIKEMMLIKVPNAEGGYRYAYPRDMTANLLTPGRMQRTMRDAILTVRSGENIVVLKTMPGTAQAVAYAIDYAKWPEVLGTVAGDDTIFVAMDKSASTAAFMDRVHKFMDKRADEEEKENS